MQEYKPRIFDCSIEAESDELNDLIASKAIQHVIDEYQSQLMELYAINNPSDAFAPDFKEKATTYANSLELAQPLKDQGKWIYYPWNATAVHVLDDSDFQKVRTARNRELISAEEQKRYYDAVIGVAGLSVGNSVALSVVLLGGARHIKLADHDTLDLSNLNRIRAGIEFLGLPKVVMTARQIYALNPYAEVEIFPEGLTEESLPSFFDGLHFVIDEIDNLAIKYRIREYARDKHLAVIMAADNDRSGVVDIERYDLKPETSFFHGRLGGMTHESLKSLDKFGIGRTIATLIGIENHTPRMLSSLSEMGKSIVSWPQLGSTALLNGALVAYVALKIANDQALTEDRAIVSMDALLDGDYNSAHTLNERSEAVTQFKKMFNL